MSESLKTKFLKYLAEQRPQHVIPIDTLKEQRDSFKKRTKMEAEYLRQIGTLDALRSASSIICDSRSPVFAKYLHRVDIKLHRPKYYPERTDYHAYVSMNWDRYLCETPPDVDENEYVYAGKTVAIFPLWEENKIIGVRIGNEIDPVVDNGRIDHVVYNDNLCRVPLKDKSDYVRLGNILCEKILSAKLQILP
jgi:hypothetical protein